MTTDAKARVTPAWVVPVAVVVTAAILIVITVIVSREREQSAGVTTGPAVATVAGEPAQPDLRAAETRDESDLLSAGPVDAPVALVVFSDYQCPFCARWNAQTLPAMMEHVESGDLRIEWRDINVFGPASERAARASYAAAKQGAFLDYHAALFADGQRRTESDLSEDALTTLAGDLGLDTAQFVIDLQSDETADVIAANQQFGFNLGATSTPVFVLGGRPIVGAQPTEIFEEAFQAALRAVE